MHDAHRRTNRPKPEPDSPHIMPMRLTVGLTALAALTTALPVPTDGTGDGTRTSTPMTSSVNQTSNTPGSIRARLEQLLSVPPGLLGTCASMGRISVSDQAGCADIGMGFDMLSGCRSGFIDMSQVHACTSSSTAEACIDTEIHNTEETMNMEYIYDSASYAEETDLQISAGGKAFGVHMSTGFDSMKSSKSSSKSVTYTIGSSFERLKTETILHSLKLRLTDEAAGYMIMDPNFFIDLYGLWYVEAFTYGGSFTGNFRLRQSATSSSEDLEQFASLSVRDVAFTAEGNEKYNNMKTSSSSSINELVTMEYSGGNLENANVTGFEPIDMGNLWNEWRDSLLKDDERAGAAKMQLTWRPMWDLEHVQSLLLDYLVAHDNDPKAQEVVLKFAQACPPSDDDMARISKEYMLTLRAQASTDDILSDYAAHTPMDQQLVDEIRSLNDDLEAHLADMDGMDASRISEIGTEVAKGDFSWFMQHNYDADIKINELLDQYPYPTLVPPSPPMAPYASPHVCWHSDTVELKDCYTTSIESFPDDPSYTHAGESQPICTYPCDSTKERDELICWVDQSLPGKEHQCVTQEYTTKPTGASWFLAQSVGQSCTALAWCASTELYCRAQLNWLGTGGKKTEFTWYHEEDKSYYETCFDTPTRKGASIPRTLYACNYGSEQPVCPH